MYVRTYTGTYVWMYIYMYVCKYECTISVLNKVTTRGHTFKCSRSYVSVRSGQKNVPVSTAVHKYIPGNHKRDTYSDVTGSTWSNYTDHHPCLSLISFEVSYRQLMIYNVCTSLVISKLDCQPSGRGQISTRAERCYKISYSRALPSNLNHKMSILATHFQWEEQIWQRRGLATLTHVSMLRK